MSLRPVLGIIACNRIVGTEQAQAVMERYVRAAMAYADVAALIIPSLPDLMTAAEVAPRLDGVLLTGSPSNVESHRYADEGGDGPFDPGRDEIALAMVEAMIGRQRPVFGICRGFQEINVAFGGSLHPEIRELPGRMNHRMPRLANGEPHPDPNVIFADRHDVRLVKDGTFARLQANAGILVELDRNVLLEARPKHPAGNPSVASTYAANF